MSIWNELREDVGAIMARDPAARSRLEVVLCYPGFHALLFHRAARALWRRGWIVAGRFVSHLGRFFTGIEIHPGARLGRRLFIDHGAGAVIGETAEIGNDVTLYHGVTLGGTALAPGKRHPTVGHGVVIGSGAQLLGPIRIGDGARIGANAVVLKDVPSGVTMVGIPARQVLPRDRGEAEPAFAAYGTPRGDLPDPLVRTVEALTAELASLRARLDALERRPAGANGDGADDAPAAAPDAESRPDCDGRA